MTKVLRPARERGHADHGWLKSAHSFSFADYYDPAHMGFRSLRVINDDWIAPSTGFGLHGHRDMEIVTYILHGAVRHQDSSGGQGVLGRGEVQSMTAGSGIRHSEYNASDSETLHLLQIWLQPNARDLPPAYQQRLFADTAKRNTLRLIAAPEGKDGALPIHQDAWVYASLLDADGTVTHHVAPGRGAWIQMAEGTITVGDVILTTGDGLAIEDEAQITITAGAPSEFLLFDLA